ncbi:MAG: coproporphyrinogen dehydrogenase HemZ [Heliobacteriaceae bacterium]|nr:coproporphyrinogen dehydrogenase HemZ [Heliobacteriaceae bacterium]MDD4587119.1 coproporphyrinogen dehydrogenase HemZ [Heliobacteriaceae bacterium]
MQIALRGVPPEYGVTLQEVLWLFFPTAQVGGTGGEPAAVLNFCFHQRPGEPLTVTASFIRGDREGWGEAAAREFTGNDPENLRRRLCKLALLRALEDFSGRPVDSWGILTGVRPTKIAHRLLDQGVPLAAVYQYLLADYAVHPAKAGLLLAVAQSQRSFFLSKEQVRTLVGVYIGIPFCPTRCLYCSFPSYELARYKGWVVPFLGALHREIAAVGTAIRQAGQQVQNIYIGGGTPTVLSLSQLAALLEWVHAHLGSAATVEYTVEGGRPDTLNREKMALLRRYGVNRLSINPQSMNDATLARIGRGHRMADVVNGVGLAREAGFPVINMDVILGLPGETAEMVGETLDRLAELRPENLTSHTMAIKRASRLTAEREQWVLPAAPEVAAMVGAVQERTRRWGMVPYYLYRQKRILANLENVGYALPGRECIYNIQMMEERQTIWGLGAGAATKIFGVTQGCLTETWHNPKEPKNYVDRIEEIIRRKLEKLGDREC